MQIDFARTSLEFLSDSDLRYLIENFPKPGRSYEEISRAIQNFPEILESALHSEELFLKIRDKRKLLLDISPFLLFSVFVRRSLVDNRIIGDKKVVNYIANLLSLFVSKDRAYRVARGDQYTHSYITDMIQEAQLVDSRRQFLIYSHIGNYSLFLTGIFPQYIEYRHKYKRRPVDIQFYVDFGKTYYELASENTLAREYELDGVFLRLSMMFEVYKKALNHLSKEYLGFS
ncbi:MAG: hypothetical protein ACE5PV_09060 [Candidatus Poribacteria bacterium]